MNIPSVSVIIPAYNAAGTIEACLRSVIEADYDVELEIIVVDDGSTDETCSIVERFNCRLIRQASNAGPAAARNAGASAASGEILVFLDSDTELKPDAIREAVRALEEPGVGAVSGMYEAEPLNTGFFPAYYAYLKYHIFTTHPVERIHAFGAQCGAIRKELFERTGGFRPFPWGMDVENDEFGHRINQCSSIALSATFRVGHNFPTLRKLMYIFGSRVYWWVRFRHYCGRDETVMMTRGLGLGTAAMPAALLSLMLAWIVTTAVGTGVGTSTEGAVVWLLLVAAAVATGGFAYTYGGFWRFCLRRRGVAFAAAACIASAFFSFVITASAAAGYLAVARSMLWKKNLPFAIASVGPA